jgi:hypothetical protein
VNFFKGLLGAIVNGAAQAVAAQTGSANLKSSGIEAGYGAIAGAIGFILQHPLGQHPAVQAAAQPNPQAPA